MVVVVKGCDVTPICGFKLDVLGFNGNSDRYIGSVMG